jgi:hypothetical protein
LHGIDLIEHCLPLIPWAGGKQFRKSVDDGHAAQAIRVADMTAQVGAETRIGLERRRSVGFALIMFRMIQSL